MACKVMALSMCILGCILASVGLAVGVAPVASLYSMAIFYLALYFAVEWDCIRLLKVVLEKSVAWRAFPILTLPVAFSDPMTVQFWLVVDGGLLGIGFFMASSLAMAAFAIMFEPTLAPRSYYAMGRHGLQSTSTYRITLDGLFAKASIIFFSTRKTFFRIRTVCPKKSWGQKIDILLRESKAKATKG